MPMTFDQATVDGTGAFLVHELERLDQTLNLPLVNYTWSRDIQLREDVSIADEISSFTNTTFAAAFPDAAFRAYVTAALGIVSGDSSVITQDQWEAIRSIDTVTVTGLGIQDLSGIEYFESMRELSCSRNALTTLDLRYNYSLTELYCERNQLTSLNVSGCPSLTALYCNDNQLTELDLSGRAVLRSLKFSGNPLVTLNASGCRKLLTLECPNGKLKSLILTKET